MKTKIAIAAAGLMAGCSTVSLDDADASRHSASGIKVERSNNDISVSLNNSNLSPLNRYKQTLAQKIAQDNAEKIYPGNPQALLRSVVVIKYVVDANGKLIHADIVRSNDDKATVNTALSALHKAAPFPPPPSSLLSHGRLEIMETMLFNDDGRFQMRSTAAPQLTE